MSNHYSEKTILSRANSVGILVFLYENGGSSKATFIQDALGGNYDSIKNAVFRLESEGLLTTQEIPGRSKYISIKLTEKGFDVAADLKRANDKILGLSPEVPMNYDAPDGEGPETESN